MACRSIPPGSARRPGIVSGLGLILQAVSAPGDEVVVFPPAYHAFRKIILANERRILDAQLVEIARALRDGPRRAARQAHAAHQGRCSSAARTIPAAPSGRRTSCARSRSFCAEHGLILVSDEIHCDLVFDGKHTPTMTAAPEIADRLITCVAATKTFNLAGAHVGACITSNPALKRRLDARIQASGLGSYNGFGMIATEAAWRTGEAWLDALLPYLRASRDLFDARIEAAAPGARAMRLDGTYLAWVDFSGDRSCARRRRGAGANRARIFASPGAQFGPGGDTWLRFNFATPRPILEEALARLDDAFADLRRSESRTMKRPVIGVIGNTRLIENRFTVQTCGETNLRAMAEVAGALPMMFAGCRDDHRYRRAARRRSTASC